jgi:hypothetical protein
MPLAAYLLIFIFGFTHPEQVPEESQRAKKDSRSSYSSGRLQDRQITMPCDALCKARHGHQAKRRKQNQPNFFGQACAPSADETKGY